MALTFKEVAEILKLIDASQAEEVVIELDGLRLVVRRRGASGMQDAALAFPATASSPGLAAPAGSSRTRSEVTVAQGRVGVRAPMVGSFYRRPSPQEEPFTSLGQRVAPGDPLCLIEVMKLFTTIEATCGGLIEAIMVEDGAAVEFDQLLFVIRPD
jgi:acetyl-CoA carboxylase biotin carboxyl carrier protein